MKAEIELAGLGQWLGVVHSATGMKKMPIVTSDENLHRPRFKEKNKPYSFI